MAPSAKPQTKNFVGAGCLCIAALMVASGNLQVASATSTVSLYRSPRSMDPVCPNKKLTFICEVVGSSPLTLIWSSEKYIGGSGAECGSTWVGPNSNTSTPCNRVVRTTEATYTTYENEQDQLVLRSRLEITTDNSTDNNNITCKNQNDGESKTINFVFVERPLPPYDVAVIETPDNSESDNNCVLLVQVCPPLNLATTDVSNYLFNPESQPNQTFPGTTASFIVRKCTSDTRVTVAAVNRCDQVGESTPPLIPNFMEKVETPSPSTERFDESAALPLGISSIVIVVIVFLIVIIMTIIVITIMIVIVWKPKKKTEKYSNLPMEEMKRSSPQHSKEYSSEEIHSLVTKAVQNVWSEMSIKQRSVGNEEQTELVEKS